MQTRLVVVLVVGLASSACVESSEPANEPLPAPGVAEVEAGSQSAAPIDRPMPFDVGDIIQRVELGFRPTGEGFEGGHALHQVDVTTQGWAFTPRHYPEPETPEDTPRIEGAPVAFGWATLRRGSTVATPDAPTVAVAEDGTLHVERGDFVETLENDEQGSEVRWEMAAQPAGSGDLVVHVPVDGQRYVGTTESGLHFKDDDSGVGVRFGHGTFIDAGGAETRVAARWVEDAIELRVPDAVLRDAAYPAVLDPTIGPEIGVDETASGPRGEDQENVDIAWGGGNWMVVWGIGRTSSVEVVATRVSPAGVVLDPAGIAVCSCNGGAPQVAFNGTHFLITFYLDRWLSGVRLTASGVPVAPLDGVQLVRTESSDHDVASDGSNFFVVYDTGLAARRFVSGRFVDAMGLPGAPSSPLAEVPRSAPPGPAVAFSGTRYYAVYADGTDVQGRFVDVLGVSEVPAPGFASVTAQASPDVAWDGLNWVVTWEHRGSDFKIHAGRVDKDGTVLDPADGVAVSAGRDQDEDPAIACSSAQECIVAFARSSNAAAIDDDIRGEHISTWFDLGGTRIIRRLGGFDISSAGGEQFGAAIAHNGTDYLASWTDDRGAFIDVNPTFPDRDVYGTRIDTSGLVLDKSGIALAVSRAPQFGPDIVSNGTDFLLVWSSIRSGNMDIYGTRVDLAGSLLDPTGLRISAHPGSEQRAAVASDGVDYLVAYEMLGSSNPGTLVGTTRVSAAGVVSARDNIIASASAEHFRHPDVASAGTNYLVTFQQDSFGGAVGVRGQLMTVAGFASGARLMIDDPGRWPAAGSNGTNYLVTYHDDGTSFVGKLVSASGVVDATSQLLLTTLSGNQVAAAEVASDGSDYLAVYKERSFSVVRGRFMSGTGVLGTTLDPIVNASGPARVVWTGSGYIVVAPNFGTASGVGIAGDVVSGPVFALPASSAGRFAGPVVASTGTPTDSVLMAWQTYAPAPYDNHRVRATFVDLLGDACTVDDDCPLGNCVDGVCCGSPCDGNCDVCSAALGATADGRCTLVAAGTVCRAVAGVCDAEEQCDGLSGACPADGFLAAVECRASAGLCDLAEACDGTGAACPAEGFVAAGTECRAASDVCDAAEVCTGTTALCPVDLLASSGTICRAAADLCDAPETCSGLVSACPADAATPAGTECRAAADVCDVAELCDGSAVACPSDGFATTGTTCRSLSGLCDEIETCDGISAGCPVDGVAAGGTACRPAAAGCDAEEVCDGVATDCPADGVLAAGIECRAALGSCDVAEACSGSSALCPTDMTLADGTACTESPSCSTDEACAAGACVGTPVDCDDSDPCTADMCTDGVGCESSPIAGCCNSAAECDDGDPCTDDGCTMNACSNTPNSMCVDAGMMVSDAGADSGTSGDSSIPPGDGGMEMPSDDEGCGCTTVGGGNDAGWPWAFVLALWIGVAVRRRSRGVR